MSEYNSINKNSRADSNISKYSSNNLKKSLELAKKICARNSNVDVNDDLQISHVIEQSNHDEYAADVHSTLLKDRIIFLCSQVDNNIAGTLIAQMLFLEDQDPEKDIYLYINSTGASVAGSGGSVDPGMAIFDTMNEIRPDVCTVCIGFAFGMGGFLLSAGAIGKRTSLPSSRIMLHQPLSHILPQEDITIQAREILHTRNKLDDLLAKHTGQPLEKIQADLASDFYMSAVEAKEYGLIDTIIDRPKFCKL